MTEAIETFEGEGTAQVCNIAGKQRTGRLVFGLLAIAGSVAGAIGIRVLGRGPLWTLALLPITWSGAVSAMQFRHRTCVALARKGLKNLDDGHGFIRVRDEQQLAAHRQRALRVYRDGVILGLILHVVLFALAAL